MSVTFELCKGWDNLPTATSWFALLYNPTVVIKVCGLPSNSEILYLPSDPDVNVGLEEKLKSLECALQNWYHSNTMKWEVF